MTKTNTINAISGRLDETGQILKLLKNIMSKTGKDVRIDLEAFYSSDLARRKVLTSHVASTLDGFMLYYINGEIILDPKDPGGRIYKNVCPIYFENINVKYLIKELEDFCRPRD